MKAFLVVVSIFAILAVGFYFSLNTRSYDLSREAQQLYDKGEYREAYTKVDEALNLNRLNRQAIALRPKLMRIVEGEDLLGEAKKLYEDGVSVGLEGNVEDAKIKMKRAYDIANSIPGLSPSKPEAKELIKNINRDTQMIIDRAPEIKYREAMKHVGSGDLVRAYEALGNIDPQTEKIQRKRSEIAYQMGMHRYNAVLSTGGNKGLVEDGIYWFSAVADFDENYADAQNKISELKKLK
ncbi:hypothetical protein [Seleniivibrio woodruffii]|uniref:hypothetical protein n=1 Tax=Seleniivibrio woodruffii TaxID=1078050 RepID=UPI002409C869|nr:hypothetical protein [Seleniivibrio woodruffii]